MSGLSLIPVFLAFAALGSGLTWWALRDSIAKHTAPFEVTVGGRRYHEPIDVAIQCANAGNCTAAHMAYKAKPHNILDGFS